MAWKNVIDELPPVEEGIEYLCVDDQGNYWLCEYSEHYFSGNAWFIQLGSSAQPYPNSITHWQELPELPEKHYV